MFRLPLLAVTAALVLGGAVTPAAHANPTICVDDVCVCVTLPCALEDVPRLNVEQHCVKADVDGDGHYETVCV